VLVAVEHRGYSLSLAGGRVRLGKNPQALVNDEPVRKMFDPSRETHRFAVVTDTHIGGYQFQFGFLKRVFEEAERRGCRFVAHAGDHVDGSTKMHAGFEYELALPSATAQANAAIAAYNHCGIPLIGIGGNHDGSHHKTSGLDVCAMIAAGCEQFKYIGPIQGWIEGPNEDPNFIRLFHPGDGCSYALSYKDQKTAEFLALSGEKMPGGFHFTGHYHKFNSMRGPNHARYFLAPAACGITDFMKARRLINTAGALFIEFTLDAKGRVDRCIVEDVVLAPEHWVRCDYSDLRPKRVPISTAGIWKV
jgi:predicted phosphodiesterase